MYQEVNQIISESPNGLIDTIDTTDTTDGYWGPVTSTIDWCESNYIVTYYIAEFWNSVSNLSFIIPPLIVCRQLWSSPQVDKVYLLSLVYMAFTGLGSFAFHSTLKFEMQLWDELSMVWSALFVLFLVIKILKPKESSSYIMPLIAYGLGTNSIYLFIKIPIIFQVCYAVIHFSVIFSSYQLSRLYPVDRRLYWATIILSTLAFLLWNIDNHFCPQLQKLRLLLLPTPCAPLTQLHALWHVLAGYGSFSLLLFCIQAQLYAKQLSYHVVPHSFAGMTLRRAEEGEGEGREGEGRERKRERKVRDFFISPADHGMRFAISGMKAPASKLNSHSFKQD